MLEPRRVIPDFRSLPLANRPDLERLRAVLVPLLLALLTQIVFVVQQQFIQTGPGHVHQPKFHLPRSCRGPAALGDVLPSASRRLDHLIVSP